MASNLYVLSNALIPGKYKIGIHSGCLSLLYSRYKTALPEMQVHYFIQNIAARQVEQTFLNKYIHKRILLADSQRLSEWVQMPLSHMTQELYCIIQPKHIRYSITSNQTHIIIIEN